MSQNPRSTCLKVSTLVVFLLFFQFSRAQYDFSELDAKFQQYQHALGGDAVILVYKDGKIVYTKDQPNFKANTQAQVGNCSKWFTAALVMTFVDEGKISLDDKVSKYLPIFSDYSKGYITIRQCLSHFTGIEDDKGGLIKTVYNTLEIEVNNFASKREIQSNPGTEFRYSNVGLNIAARVVEIVGKRSFEQLIQQRLFRPMSMRSSTFQLDYDKPVNPSTGAYSSAIDYTNFLSMLLNKGMFKEKRILSENAIEEMERSQTSLPLKSVPKGAEGWNYGLGEWVLEQDNTGKTTCVACPGFPGAWPMIDNCRGYAAVVFVKKPYVEQKKELFMDIKKSIDAQIPCNN